MRGETDGAATGDGDDAPRTDATERAGEDRVADAGSSGPPADEETTTGSSSAGVTLTLWTRTPVCGTPTTVIDRLGRLRATGAVEEFEVRTWPDEVVLSEVHDEDPVVETFRRFEAWATERGLSVRPGFDVRTVSSLLGRTRELLTLPMICLAVTDDGELVGVFPCGDGERTWTVEDCLDAFEAGDGVPPVASR
jgi:hypothetical protein